MSYRFGHEVMGCNLNELKAQLLDTLRNIKGFEIKPSPVAGGTAQFYNDNELGLRLTKQVSRCISCLTARLQAFGPDCRLVKRFSASDCRKMLRSAVRMCP